MRDTLINIFPENPFDSLVNANMLQIIFLALIIGMGIINAGQRGVIIRNFFDSSFEVVNNITGLIMRLTPIGVFGLMVPVVANNGLEVLLPLIKVIIAFYIAVNIHMFLIYGMSVKLFSEFTIFSFFKGILPARL